MRPTPPPRPRTRDRFARPGGGFPHSLRWRSTLPFAATILLFLIVLGVYQTVAVRQLDADRLADRLVREARLVATTVPPSLLVGAAGDQVAAFAVETSGLLDAHVSMIDGQGRLLGDSGGDAGEGRSSRASSEVTAARRLGSGTAVRRGGAGEGEIVYAAAAIPGGNGAVVRLAVPVDRVRSAVGRVGRVASLAVLLALVAVVGVGVVVADRISRPIDDLRDGFRAVAAGRLDARIGTTSTRELDELGQAFNGMVKQIRVSREEEERARIRLEATLANLSDGVVVTDPTGGLVRLNGSAVHLLGLSAVPPPGQPFVQVSRDHELAALLAEALATKDGKSRLAEVEHGRSRRVLEATAQWVPGTRESLGLVVLRDVTELRRLERVRREFVANVSHELRTPLASIKALVETLEAGAVDDPTVAGDFLHRIVGEVDRLAVLVDELLDLARLQSGRVSLDARSVDPHDLLGRASERLRPQTERARLTLGLDVPPGLPPVLADRARVEQVVLNLLHNAIKFTPPGGRVTIGATQEKGALEVFVRDTGVGVPEEELPRLFERFYKADKARRSEGTGLGLAIAKHIVQAHGGTIWAESRPGDGATFRFTLPLAEPGEGGLVVVSDAQSEGRARPATRPPTR